MAPEGDAQPKRRGRPENKVEITDPKAIRALAHAARLEVISELYSTQSSRTATELAQQTGLTPSAMSYHLRALRNGGSWLRPRRPAMPANAAGRRPARTSPSTRAAGWPAPTSRCRPRTGGLPPPRQRLRQGPERAAASAAKSRSRPAAVVLASNLLYLTPAAQLELTRRSSNCCGTTSSRTRTHPAGGRADRHHVVHDSGRPRHRQASGRGSGCRPAADLASLARQ